MSSDSVLAKVVAQVESGGFPYAIRFEDIMFKNVSSNLTQAGIAALQVIKSANHCSDATARMIYCSSFGIWQILGMTLYSTLAWKQSVIEFARDPETQLDQFNRLCHGFGVDPATFDFSNDAQIEHFATRYNGPGDVPNYVAKLRNAYEQIAKA